MNEPQSVRTPKWLTLAPDERVRVRATPSSKVLLAGIVTGFLLLVVGSIGFAAVGAVDVGRRVTLALLAIIVLFVGGSFFAIHRREYVLTTDRACIAVGFRSKTVAAIELQEVDEVALVRSRWHRWLNAGDIRFAANDGEILTFGFVENPRFVSERALDLV